MSLGETSLWPPGHGSQGPWLMEGGGQARGWRHKAGRGLPAQAFITKSVHQHEGEQHASCKPPKGKPTKTMATNARPSSTTPQTHTFEQTHIHRRADRQWQHEKRGRRKYQKQKDQKKTRGGKQKEKTRNERGRGND